VRRLLSDSTRMFVSRGHWDDSTSLLLRQCNLCKAFSIHGLRWIVVVIVIVIGKCSDNVSEVIPTAMQLT
jgi:hypothetical protein